MTGRACVIFAVVVRHARIRLRRPVYLAVGAAVVVAVGITAAFTVGDDDGRPPAPWNLVEQQRRAAMLDAEAARDAAAREQERRELDASIARFEAELRGLDAERAAAEHADEAAQTDDERRAAHDALHRLAERRQDVLQALLHLKAQRARRCPRGQPGC